jgi:hypothetical protein
MCQIVAHGSSAGGHPDRKEDPFVIDTCTSGLYLDNLSFHSIGLLPQPAYCTF